MTTNVDNPPIEDIDLKNHPTVKSFASMSDETYALIKTTNPTLLVFVDLAKKIVEEGES